MHIQYCGNKLSIHLGRQDTCTYLSYPPPPPKDECSEYELSFFLLWGINDQSSDVLATVAAGGTEVEVQVKTREEARIRMAEENNILAIMMLPIIYLLLVIRGGGGGFRQMYGLR